MADETVDGLTFEQWMRLVNRECVKVCGLGCDDLPDVEYWDMWESGYGAADAVQEVLENAGYPSEDGE